MTPPCYTFLFSLVLAGLSLTAPVQAGVLAPPPYAQTSQGASPEISLRGIEIHQENLYHKAQSDPNYYQICIFLSVKSTAKRPCTVEWEHTIRGAGPAEFSIRKKGASAPIKEEPYPCGSNCRNVTQKLTKKKPVEFHYTSAVLRLDDLDEEYEVSLQGKVKVNGQWKNYSFQQTIIPRDLLSTHR